MITLQKFLWSYYSVNTPLYFCKILIINNIVIHCKFNEVPLGVTIKKLFISLLTLHIKHGKQTL